MTQTLRELWRTAPRLVRLSIVLMLVEAGIGVVVATVLVLRGENPLLTAAWVVVGLAVVVWFATQILRGRLWAMLAFNIVVAMVLGLSITDLALSVAGVPMFGWPPLTALLNIPSVAAATLLWLPGTREHFVRKG